MNAINLGPICSDNSLIYNSLNNFQSFLKIEHWNVTSFCASTSSGKLDEIRHILEGNHLDIVGFSETWLKSYVLSQAVNIPGYHLCRHDRQDGRRGGGVALLISDRFKFRTVFLSEVGDVCEALFIEISVQDTKLLIGVCYLPDGDLGAFENSVGDLLVRYTNIIVVGDFNKNLFCPIDSTTVRSMCMRLDLTYHHNSIPTHFHAGCNTTSLIDFFLLSDTISICTSGQMQCPGVSHHSLIFMAIDIPISSSPCFVSYPDYKALKAEDLATAVQDSDFSGIYFTNDVNLQLEIVMSNIVFLHDLVPVVRKRVGARKEDWFNNREIHYQKSLRDLAYRHYMQCWTPLNWKVFCVHRNRVKKVIRKLRMREHAHFFQDSEPETMWKFLKKNGCLETREHLTMCNPDNLNEFVRQS